jgi:thiol:disulfide interchange protein
MEGKIKMNKRILLILVTAFLLACNALDPQTPRSTSEPALKPSEPEDIGPVGFTIVRLHPQDGNLQTMLTQEAKKAVKLGQMPVVEFDATWCPPCQAIDKWIKAKDKSMLEAYAGTYIIKLDVDEWAATNGGIQDFKFEGIPVYFKLDAEGHPTGEVIDGGAWGEDIPENIAPPMDKFFHGD